MGEGVAQKGSLVTDTHLRFDFSHHFAVTDDEIKRIEQIVNEQIRLNIKAEAEVMPKDEAMKRGALALFGEKYGETVLVIGMGDFSTELCGGTHIDRTGDIGLLKIVSEGGVAAGVRRIEAVTGKAADSKDAGGRVAFGRVAGIIENLAYRDYRQSQTVAREE